MFKLIYFNFLNQLILLCWKHTGVYAKRVDLWYSNFYLLERDVYFDVENSPYNSVPVLGYAKIFFIYFLFFNLFYIILNFLLIMFMIHNFILYLFLDNFTSSRMRIYLYRLIFLICLIVLYYFIGNYCYLIFYIYINSPIVYAIYNYFFKPNSVSEHLGFWREFFYNCSVWWNPLAEFLLDYYRNEIIIFNEKKNMVNLQKK